MSRKSEPKKSSLYGGSAIECPSLNKQRLDLDTIVDIDPWKDIEKYDKQEAGQIQQVLVQFNDMVLNDKKNKRRSVGMSQPSISSTKTIGNNEAIQDESTIEENMRNDAVQPRIRESSANYAAFDVLLNVNHTDDTNDNKNTVEEEREDKLEGMEEKSSKAINRVERKLVGKKRASSIKPRASKEATEKRSFEKQKINKEKFQHWFVASVDSSSTADIEENINSNNKRDNESTESFEEGNKDREKKEETIRNAVADKNIVVDDTEPSNDQFGNTGSIELPSDEPSNTDSYMHRETVIAVRDQPFESISSTKTLFENANSDSESYKNNYFKRVAAITAKQSSIVNAQPENNNRYQSKHTRKGDEKIAKAFDKFGKQFVKYTIGVEHLRDCKTGPIDSDSDSSSIDDSSGSSSNDESSSSSSYPSSQCSCCSSSSSNSSSCTSCSDSYSASSCSCCSCCEDDEYSEYTLASSSSTYLESSGSADSATE